MRRLKYACYTTNVSMAVVANLSPVLFITFHERYGISFSLLGLLVLINFVTQLLIDLVFSFFSHKFNIKLTVKITPLIATVGLLVYALWPFVFPNHVYLGLLVGTLIFSASGGLAEVLISPVIAAIPSDEPEREMSKLHSIYAWGVVFVIIVSTLFLLGFGNEKWQYLTLIFTIIPLISFSLFLGAKIPEMQTNERVSGALNALKNKTLWLCVTAIFLGGASELVMAQWSSGYLEQALGIEKVWGDIFGVAMFGATLGLGRTLYAKFGKNVTRVLLLGAIGATACYLTAALSGIPILGLIACALTGFCVSMMWPG
ncbi:MAG: MFS transporter, partial [Clostridia bacterium]|nr:MFS transporter [Clostridia bacterium]